MIDPREPIVTPVPVEELRPTQITVGMREVALKRQMIRAQDAKKKTGTFLGKHMVPVVLGPKIATTLPITITSLALCSRKAS